MWKLINGRMVWFFAPDEPPTGGADDEDKKEDKKDDPPAPEKDEDKKESDLLLRIKADPARAEKELLDLRHEAEANRKKLKDIEDAAEAARVKALADNQQFETLYNESNTKLAAATARITELETELEAYHQSDAARLEVLSTALPDHLRDLVAKMTPRDALMWIEAHESELRKPSAPGTDAGASGSKLDSRFVFDKEPAVRL